MELGIARSNCSVKISSHSVLIDLTSLLLQFISKKINQILHQVTLSHQQVLSDVNTMAFEPELCEEDLEKLFVRLLMCLLNPLLEFVSI